jgi:hypothetical protein
MSTSSGTRSATSATRAPRTAPASKASTKAQAAQAAQGALLQRAQAHAQRTVAAAARLQTARERNSNAYHSSRKGVFSPGMESALGTRAREVENLPFERFSINDARTNQQLLSKDGHRYADGIDQVRLNLRELGLLSGNVEMHNHPNAQSPTFSQTDIQSTRGRQTGVGTSVGTRVVTGPGRGRLQGTATMLPPRNGQWPKWSAINASFKRHEAAITSAMMRAKRQGKVSVPRGFFGLDKSNISHLVWRQVARDTGMRYSRRIKG